MDRAVHWNLAQLGYSNLVLVTPATRLLVLILDPVSWTQDPGFRILHTGSRIMELGCRIQELGSSIPDPGSWI